MLIVIIVVAVLLVGVFAALALGVNLRMSVGMPPATTSSGEPLLPAVVGPSDVDALRFDRAFRGYRMDQVDAALDRLRSELAERDAVLADYQRSRTGSTNPAVAAGPDVEAGSSVE